MQLPSTSQKDGIISRPSDLVLHYGHILALAPGLSVTLHALDMEAEKLLAAIQLDFTVYNTKVDIHTDALWQIRTQHRTALH